MQADCPKVGHETCLFCMVFWPVRIILSSPAFYRSFEPTVYSLPDKNLSDWEVLMTKLSEIIGLCVGLSLFLSSLFAAHAYVRHYEAEQALLNEWDD
jgi:hypothetical protein